MDTGSTVEFFTVFTKMTENIYNIGRYVTFVETATGNEPGYLRAAVSTMSYPGNDHRYLGKTISAE